MSPLERLYAEEWPDGTFGGPRPADAPPAPAPCHAEAAAHHYAQLEAAITRRQASRRPRKATP